MCKSFLPFFSNSFPVNLRRSLFAPWWRDTVLLRAAFCKPPVSGHSSNDTSECSVTSSGNSLHTHLPQSWCGPRLWSSTSLSQVGGCQDPAGLNASLGALEIPLAGGVGSFSQGFWFCVVPCRLWRGCVKMSEVGDGTWAKTRDLLCGSMKMTVPVPQVRWFSALLTALV